MTMGALSCYVHHQARKEKKNQTKHTRTIFNKTSRFLESHQDWKQNPWPQAMIWWNGKKVQQLCKECCTTKEVKECLHAYNQWCQIDTKIKDIQSMEV